MLARPVAFFQKPTQRTSRASWCCPSQASKASGVSKWVTSWGSMAPHYYVPVRADTGSTRVALLAGSTHATRLTVARSTTTPAMTRGSVGSMP